MAGPQASSFINALKMLYHVANIGDSRKLGNSPGIDHALAAHRGGAAEDRRIRRLCPAFGRNEYIDDIVADLDQALAAA